MTNRPVWIRSTRGRRGEWWYGWCGCYSWGRGPDGRRGALPSVRQPVAVESAWPPEEGNGATLLKKVLTWLAIAFVVFYVIQRPEDAAGIVRSAGGALSDAADSLSAFVESLV